MCEKHTAQNFIFILLLEFQFFYRFFAMGVFIVAHSLAIGADGDPVLSEDFGDVLP